jgi:hypothetical protein
MADSEQTGAFTDTYAYTKETVETLVVPRIITQSDLIATFFVEDLEEFVRLSHTDLAKVLQIPPDYPQDTRDILLMLYEDIAHMLRDQLITGVHLLLSELNPDSNTGAYPLRYHARYTITPDNSTSPLAPSTSTTSQRIGKTLAPPRNIWRDARFALLIDWNPSAKDRRQKVRRPEYCFDWVPEEARFDPTNLLRYNGEGSFLGEVVIRHEMTSPAYQKQQP